MMTRSTLSRPPRARLRSMDDQADSWSRVAADYEQEFIDPDLPEVRNPVRRALARVKRPGCKTVADLGCGIGPLLPFLAERFGRVVAVDFADGMLRRARERCRGHANVEFLERPLTDLTPLVGQLDVAVAVNSLVMPEIGQIEAALGAIHAALKPKGLLLGIVPSIDSVHYMTMLLVDRARQAGMPEAKARQNAAQHAEHELFDFAFGDFRMRGIRQHFWQPFEVRARLRHAGFRRIRIEKVPLAWRQFACARDLAGQPPPWDWFFEARR
jgi:SAM-dependent methyltransferase